VWGNTPPGVRVLPHSCPNAGWETSDVDMEGRKLVFRRIRKAPPDDTGFSDRPQPPLQQGPHSLTVSGLDDITLTRLEARARLQSRSVEEVAREVLQRGAALKADERLALADRTRAMSPGLHDVDLVAMIREDRDNR
jgi:plasmid stability protein